MYFRYVGRTITSMMKCLVVEDEIYLEPSGRHMRYWHKAKSTKFIQPVPSVISYRFAYTKSTRGQIHWKKASAPVLVGV